MNQQVTIVYKRLSNIIGNNAKGLQRTKLENICNFPFNVFFNC
jgi:hypothetical protein